MYAIFFIYFRILICSMHEESEWQIDNVTEKEDRRFINSVDWAGIHGWWWKCWNRQIHLGPTLQSVSFYMNKELGKKKSLAKTIQGLSWGWKDAELLNLQGFSPSILKKKGRRRKKISHPGGLKCKVNSFTWRPLPPKACIVSPNLF